MAGVSGPGPAVAILSMRFLKISEISLSLTRRSLTHTHKHRGLHDFSIRPKTFPETYRNKNISLEVILHVREEL